jgi:hypothetical protein
MWTIIHYISQGMLDFVNILIYDEHHHHNGGHNKIEIFSTLELV